MRRFDHSAPFDSELEGPEDHADLTDEFWGEAPTWRTREHSGEIGRTRSMARAGRRSSDDTTGAIRALRDGIDAFRPQRRDRRDVSGEVSRTRVHGVVAHQRSEPAQAPREATIAELAAGWGDEPIPAQPTRRVDALSPTAVPRDVSGDAFNSHDDTELVPLTGIGDRLGVGAVDPLLARLGALVVVGVLLVPLALALRPSSDSATVQSTTPRPVTAGASATDESMPFDGSTDGAPTPNVAASVPMSQSVDSAAPAADASTAGATEEGSSTAEPAPSEPTSDVGSGVDSSTTSQSSSTGAVTLSEGSSTGEAASVSATAERVVPACPLRYTVGAGDSWYRIAEAAGVSPNELLNENRATLDTVIFTGDEICLPHGATMPSTPTTTIAPTSTDAPSTTQAPTTTAAPTTTEAPSSLPVIVSTDEVQRLIREIWPEDQHEKALQVAWRESRYHADADNNFCCYGVFQIYYTVHQSWLDDFGVHRATDLFDARKNITAAYELYQLAGGWGPWGG